MSASLRIGARGSDLSLAQTRLVAALLRAARPGIACEIVTIQTHGDRHTAAMELLPIGGFVTEIEQALAAGRIDLAVHSLKDLPTEDAPGLTIAAIPPRANPADVLLTRQPVRLDALPVGLVVGTSSPRRAAQITRFAPHVRTAPIRGNVPTRVRKLLEGEFDAVILAAAGLDRLGLTHPHRVELPAPDFLPAPGQGALAVQARESSDVRARAAVIDDPQTRAAVAAERALLRASGGGCRSSLGALGVVRSGELILRGQQFFEGRPVAAEVRGRPEESEALGVVLAEKLRALAGRIGEPS